MKNQKILIIDARDTVNDDHSWVGFVEYSNLHAEAMKRAEENENARKEIFGKFKNKLMEEARRRERRMLNRKRI